MNSNAIVNWDQLVLLVGEEDGAGDDEMRDLYRMFVADARARLRKLVSTDLAFDRTGVAKEAHKIRGAASSFGFERVANLLRVVEAEISELHQERIECMLMEALQAFESSVDGVVGRFPALAA